MNCQKCGSQIWFSCAYCPYCGVKTEALKNNSKGIFFIKPENLLVTGISILFVGILLMAVMLLLHANMMLGLGLAVAVIGVTLLVKGRHFINSRSELQNHCKYCDQEIMENWNYCCRCGSKTKR